MSQRIIHGGGARASVRSGRLNTFAAVALGMAISPLLIASAQAQVASTWTGAVNQDWNNAGNWSNGLPVGGNATVNLGTGNTPIVSTDPTFTPTDIIVGDGAGNTGVLTHTAGSLATGVGNWAYIGTAGGNGTYNQSGGSFTSTELRVAAGANSQGSVTSTGGTITTNYFLMSVGNTAGVANVDLTNTTVNVGQIAVVNDSPNNTATSTGVLNVRNGSTFSTEGDLIVSSAGSATSSGTLNIEAGGTVNVATTTKRWLIVNKWDTTQGILNVNGGTLNLNANTDLRFSTGNGGSVGTSVVNLNGGAINSYSGNGTGAGAGIVDLMQQNAAGNNTLNLNGGTLTVRQVTASTGNGTTAVNFNGGTLKATGDTAQFVAFTGANQTANIQNGGAVIDTNGYNVTIPEPLLAAGTGGLTKTGTGTLTLSGASTYTGATVINGGTLRLASGGPPQAIGNYTFNELADGSLAGGAVVANTGTGGVALNGVVNHADNVFDAINGGASVVAGRSGAGKALALDGLGSSVDVASSIVEQAGGGSWTFSSWINTTEPGSSIISKDDGNDSWNFGDSVFYLGSNPISGTPGSLPTAVRNSGGFMQGDPTPVSLTDGAWHMVTFVSVDGVKQIYVDGVATTMTIPDFVQGDNSTKTRFGYNIDTLANLDGNVDFFGAMDDLKFFDVGLNAAQVQQLFTTGNVSTGVGSQQFLPSATAVSIPVAGATLDLNSNSQQIGSLAGVAGSSVTLGSATLTTGANNTSTSYAGVVSGTGGITKIGTGTQTLTGANTYTGVTTVKGGVLSLAVAAQSPVLGSGSNPTPAGADIQGGKLVLSYTGASIAPTVQSILDAGYDQSTKFSSGRLRSTTLAANRVLGWRDTGSAVEVAYTLPGDADLTFAVGFDDLLLLAQNYNGTGKVWSQGDFDYNALVNFDDLLLLAQNYNSSVTPAQSGQLGSAFMADFVLAQSLVPEPTTLAALVGLGGAALIRRRKPTK